ncbi:MAG: hypothetical protein ACYC5H_15350 [Methylovirgula sp.]
MTRDAVAPQTIAPEIDRLSETSPSTDFRQRRAWPISELALAALVDLGLSDERIARYFHVALGNVQSLRLRFGVQPHHF